MRLVIESQGGETVIDRQLMRFAENVAIPTRAFTVLGKQLRDIIDHQFQTQGAASGGWEPLADSTIKEKARRGLDPRILIATDDLHKSLTRKFDPNHIEQRVSMEALIFGTRVPYGIFHQKGTEHMPARPPVALTAGDRVLLVKEVQAALLGLRAPGSFVDEESGAVGIYT